MVLMAYPHFSNHNFAALAYVGAKTDDYVVIEVSFIFIASILGFFVWNYPLGKSFWEMLEHIL